MRKELFMNVRPRVLTACCATLALVCFGQALWIHAKAAVAQVLIASAWERTLARSDAPQKPWHWADTWPVARLQWNEHGAQEDLFVLAGATGNALAFGPGQLAGTAPIGAGASVIAGHRDTHFAFLRNLQPGSVLHVQDSSGERFVYTVADMAVRDSSKEPLLIDPASDSLTLVTCYPFDTPLVGGPERYVVTALRSEF